MAESLEAHNSHIPKIGTMQGLSVDPFSSVPEFAFEGEVIAIYDLVWRSSDEICRHSGNVSGYSNKTVYIHRVDDDHGKFIYRRYKAYFVYLLSDGKTTLTNEYNCRASEDEKIFHRFTFLKKGQHDHMEQPLFLDPDARVSDDIGNPFMGLCMVSFRGTGLPLIGGWAKLRNPIDRGGTAELTRWELLRLSDSGGVAKAIFQKELFDHRNMIIS